jgi:FKBP-type peptidyl-prolyl cis-trans isomerase
MRFLNIFFSATAIAALMSSCSNVDFKKTNGGMPYKLFASKNGKKVEPGTIIKVNFIQKLNDSVLYTTYDKSPVYFPVTNQTQPYDISELIPTLKQGDSVYAVQLIDTFMKRNPSGIPPQFKKGDRIISTIKVLEVFKNPDEAQKDEAREKESAFNRDPKVQNQLQKDTKTITDYLAKNNIAAQKTGHGTYVQIITPGQGPKIEMGKFVSLRYRGTTMDGREFDSNMDGKKPALDFEVSESGMIKGFLEGILALNKGTIAKLYIPSPLGYGSSAPPEIGPDQNLIFDIEVKEVENQPSTPKMPSSPINDTIKR